MCNFHDFPGTRFEKQILLAHQSHEHKVIVRKQCSLAELIRAIAVATLFMEQSGAGPSKKMPVECGEPAEM
eukprot:4576880-Amphidinium_carterae.1